MKFGIKFIFKLPFILMTLLNSNLMAASWKEFYNKNPEAYQAYLCKQLKNSKCTNFKQTEKLLLSFCEGQMSALNCSRLEKDPAYKDYVRRCTKESLCTERTMEGDLKACADNLPDTIEKLKKYFESQSEIYKKCNTSIQCKRDLIGNDPRYKNLSDKEISKLDSKFLFVQSQNYKNMISQFDRAPRSSFIYDRSSSQVSGDLSNSTSILELDVDIANALKAIWTLSREIASQEYEDYKCLNDLGRLKLECKVKASLLLGGISKSLNSMRFDLRTHKSLEHELPELTKPKRTIKRKEFIATYYAKEASTEAERAQFVSKATMANKYQSKSKLFFFDTENAWLKKLNDMIHDKGLIDSMNNYYFNNLRNEFENLHAKLKLKNPDLKMYTYSDFKSFKVGFEGDVSPEIQEEIQKIYAKARVNFIDVMKAQKLVREGDHPEEWFRAGIGETPDEANLVARYSRTQDPGHLTSYNNPVVQEAFKKKLSDIHKLEKELERDFKHTSVVKKEANGGFVVDERVIDVIRKSGDDLSTASSLIKNELDLQQLPEAAVRKIKNYITQIDEFQPPLYIVKREKASLSGSLHGGITADLVGMGSKNLQGTMRAISMSDSPQKMILLNRDEELKLTEAINKQREHFRSAVERSLGKENVKVICSGDDCVATPNHPLSIKERERVIQAMTEGPRSDQFRLSFVGNQVPTDEVRNKLAIHGEIIEKHLRKSLKGTKEINPYQLANSYLALDMRGTTLGEGYVKLMVASRATQEFTPSQKQILKDKFKEVVSEINQALKEDGISGNYEPIFDF